jgi:aconitate hydratase
MATFQRTLRGRARMGASLAHKILRSHLVQGRLQPGAAAALRVDQTLTQDATGTMVWLAFEAMGLPRIRAERSVSYIDHNMIQADFRNPDDHRYLQTVAAKHGAYFSRAGNGICHQVHLERFAAPGKTLLGSDSHTPNAGGIGALGIGAGGMDVAVAMAGGAFHITVPTVVGVRLTGGLRPWVSAKDVILEVLRRLSVKGGVGKIMEYHGAGVSSLSVDERATICNMGAELGATSSVFPSDERTLAYLRAQGREQDWQALAADANADYDEEITVDLSALEPLIACPSSPDNVVPVRELEGTPVAQVCVGSCVNSSYEDLSKVAAVLEGHTVHEGVSMTVTPGSKQVYSMIADSGALSSLIASGARVLESACGPCVGMGQAPPTGAVSVRSFNRNFKGRSGTKDDSVYLASPETCAAAALRGVIVDPRSLGELPSIVSPARYATNDNMIVPPAVGPDDVEVIRGPNIKPMPPARPVSDEVRGRVLIKVDDNVTTDHIMPAGVRVLPLRSNIPAISEYVFWRVDQGFVERAKEWGGGVIVGGLNYGQGSSREHAALAPMYLGVKAVVAKSFSRIHHANLVNAGILPLIFADDADHDRVKQGDEWEILGVREALAERAWLQVRNLTGNQDFELRYDLTDRQVDVLLAGGLLNYIKTGGI